MQAFQVWKEESYKEEAVTIYAYDKEDAAKKFAREYDAGCGEYPFATLGGVVVVRQGTKTMRDEHDKPERFLVEGEAVPRYYASKLR